MIQGYAYGKTGQPARQIDAYLQAIHIDEYSADAYVCLGVAYGNAARAAEEIKAYEQALQVNPNEGSALFNLGHYYLARGDRDRGMDYYARLKTVDPELVRIFFDDLNSRIYPETVNRR